MKQALDATARGLRTFVSDVVDGFFEITHNSFALLGLATVFAVLALAARPDLRQTGEEQLMGWLQSRKPAPEVTEVSDLEPTAIERTTAASPHELPKQQAAVAYWLSKKYRVAAEPLSVLVAEAFDLGKKTKLDPTLILAIMAVESSFNPFAQSQVGAQGLMQVMTRVHGEKYESAGGTLTAFDPVTNMRVGVKVLQECIARAGSALLRRRRQPDRGRRLRRQGAGRARTAAPGDRRPRPAHDDGRAALQSGPGGGAAGGGQAGPAGPPASRPARGFVALRGAPAPAVGYTRPARDWR
jgi:hypothetical protein